MNDLLEQDRHRSGRLETILERFGERAGEPFIEALGRAPGQQSGDGQILAVGNGNEQLAEGVGVKGKLSTDRLVSHRCECPDVSARIDVRGADDLLRAHVVRRPDHHSLGREPGSSAARVLGDAEIEHLDEQFFLIFDDEDVLWLDVAMNDAERVCFLEHARYLTDESNGLGQAEPLHQLQPVG